MELSVELKEKLKNLQNLLLSYKKMAVAYSGGVDSTFLLYEAYNMLKNNVLAVTSISETMPSGEKERAARLAKQFGVNQIVIKTCELDNENFSSNPPDRCFYCKQELFFKIKGIAKEHKISVIADGTNFDDKNDYRPGMNAKKEAGVISPLFEAKLTKDDIRLLSRNYNLETWSEPASPCLSSRFPYNEQITPEKLKMVDLAEAFLKRSGFKEVRVRIHKDLARIELPEKEISKIFVNEMNKRISTEFEKIGFLFITLDLGGYKMGSMNRVLK